MCFQRLHKMLRHLLSAIIRATPYFVALAPMLALLEEPHQGCHAIRALLCNACYNNSLLGALCLTLLPSAPSIGLPFLTHPIQKCMLACAPYYIAVLVLRSFHVLVSLLMVLTLGLKSSTFIVFSYSLMANEDLKLEEAIF